MKVMLAAALLASISLAPAFAADTSAKPAEAKPADAKPTKPATDQKLICTKEPQVGSIIIKKVCRTPEQVEADRRAAQAVADQRASLAGSRADLPPGR